MFSLISKGQHRLKFNHITDFICEVTLDEYSKSSKAKDVGNSFRRDGFQSLDEILNAKLT